MPYSPQPTAWDQAPLHAALHNLSLQGNGSGAGPDWFLDTGATSHMANHPGIVSNLTPYTNSSRVVVGDGSSLPITHVGDSSFPTASFPIHLRNVAITPDLIKNLISVRSLTRHNPITVEFDAFGFSIKDLHTRAVILRCDSDGELYPLVSGRPRQSLHASTTTDLWHQRLGHPGFESLSKILASFQFTCNKSHSTTCHACRLGKHVRLPFQQSVSRASVAFELLHCDVWTSPVKSISGFQFYLVILDDFSHYAWTFPLRRKSDVFPALSSFHAFVTTQFQRPVLSFQTDNGREFDNNTSRAFFS
jgi:hypothetical protein